jgi:hypothetical protein
MMPPPQAPSGNRTKFIIGGAAAAVLIVVGVVLALVLGGGGGSPKGVVQNYLDAAKSRDVNTMRDLTCDRYKSAATENGTNFNDELNGAPNNVQVNFNVGDENITGDTATVQVTLDVKVNGESMPTPALTVHLVKEGGSWKICEGP